MQYNSSDLHRTAVVALCLGMTTVSDHYRFALMVSARHGQRRTRRAGARGISAAAFGATFSAAGKR